MEKPGLHSFKVGQLAEMRTFEGGFRSAWFRCKINDIRLEENKIFLEYPDFDEEDPGWVEIYQTPPYGKKSKHIKKQLMVRPEYPVIYHKDKDEMPPVNSISQACVVIDGTWKVGNMVDWLKDDCYWSAKIVEVLSDDKVQIELPKPPVGQGKKGEKGKLEAFCKDLRPWLDWSETKGWTFHKVGQTPCDARLIFPTKQGMDLEVEHDGPMNASSTTRIPEDGDENSEQNEKAKRGCDLVASSDSVSSLRVEKRKATEEVEKRDLNIMHEDTLEAAILDLEELVNKVKWLQRLLQSHSSTATTTTSSWKIS